MRAFSDLTEFGFDPEERARLRAFWAVYEAHRAIVSQEVLAAIRRLPDFEVLIEAIAEEQTPEQQRNIQEAQRLGIEEGLWGPFIQDLRDTGARYARVGARFGAWFPLFSAFRDAVRKQLVAESADHLLDPTLDGGLALYLDFSVALLGEAYLEAKEAIIRDQQEAIRELSTPVLQLHDRLLILPVVGLVDTQRARDLTTSLMGAIGATRAVAVVMDITGVPLVDAAVAHHLLRTCEAVRLMGAQVILTGISPKVAETLTTTGARLGGVRVLGDLRAGLEAAKAVLGLETAATRGASPVQIGCATRTGPQGAPE